MKWFWLATFLLAALDLCRSDEQRRKRWRERLDDENAPTIERVVNIIVMAFAAWQALSLWGLR